MNKLIVEKNSLTLDNCKVNLDIKTNNLTLNINNTVTIYDINNNQDLNLKLILMPNSNLIYERYNNNINKLNLDIVVSDNTKLSYNQSILTNNKTIINVNSIINGNNNDTKINIYGVSKNKGLFNIYATGDIKDNIKDNELLENIRVLMLNEEENIIVPNLLVSSDKVSVNHNATISSIDKELLFYLESKGLSKPTASKLIIQGFLLNKIPDLEVKIDA